MKERSIFKEKVVRYGAATAIFVAGLTFLASPTSVAAVSIGVAGVVGAYYLVKESQSAGA